MINKQLYEVTQGFTLTVIAIYGVTLLASTLAVL